ncbi:hypothetical protein TNCT_406811 [Trichonephila clavata]|uniref:Uncharacterized protein n=1 Tax=Trichonephila clavata TaxID=2740835 RepID=A0A8X6FFU4_TRICU|nr:hypothetical protein TNCT_406811 [Trichonephila clavata]
MYRMFTDNGDKMDEKYMEVSPEEFPEAVETDEQISVEAAVVDNDSEGKDTGVSSETEHRTVMMVVSDQHDDNQGWNWSYQMILLMLEQLC